LYLQLELGKELLLDFKHANEQILSDFDVDMTHYGKYDISGIRDDEPEPCPRTWDPLRKMWND
jgi:small subunit ribosomal protein S29